MRQSSTIASGARLRRSSRRNRSRHHRPTLTQGLEGLNGYLLLASGNATYLDQLIGFLAILPIEEQILDGLDWVWALVSKGAGAVAGRSFLLPDWLAQVRPVAETSGRLDLWQRIVDSLVVAGDTRLAKYSE
jgi:hypothetical protein